MTSRPNILPILLFTCVSHFFLTGLAYTQSNLEKKIDVRFENTGLVRAIKMISEVSEVNFTYDPAILPIKTISKSFREQTIKNILSDILSGQEISFVELSGQIILYRSEDGFGFIPKLINKPLDNNSIEEEKPLKGSSFQSPKKSVISDHDTIYVHHYDTVYLTRYDTIVRIEKDTVIDEMHTVDTIVMPDTVTIFDKIYANKIKKSYKPWLSAEIVYSWQPQIKFQMTDVDNQIFSERLSERIRLSKVQGYGIMAKLNAQFSWLSVQTGLGFNQLIQHFEHIHESFGGYNRTDTIEIYYTVQETDTNWFYVTEDTWMETYEIARNISKVNFQSLQIPLILGYSMRVKNFSFELCAGFHTEIPLQSEISVYFDTTGLSISEDNYINNLKFKTQNPTFSYSVSLSINYLLNKNLCLVVAPYYYSNISSFYRKGEPLQQKNNYYSINLGLRYYFMTNHKNSRN